MHQFLVAIIYYALVRKFMDVIHKDNTLSERVQYSYKLSILLAISGIIIPQYFIKINNEVLNSGLIIGSWCLLLMSLLEYWDAFSDEWVLLLLGILFAYILFLFA